MKPRPPQRSPAYLVASVDNALRLLHLLRDVGEVRVTDAAAELGVSLSTVHRLMSMLVYRGFAVQDESRTYHPGPAVGVEPVRSPGTHDLRTAARPHLAALRDDVDESAYCMIMVGRSVRFVLAVESRHPTGIGDRHGLVLPTMESAGGQAILAALPNDRLREFFSSLEQDGILAPAVERLRLRLRLRLVRSRGYALSIEEVEHGIVSVAVPLSMDARHPPAAVSVSGSPSRLESVVASATIERLTRARDAVRRDLAARSESS